MADSRLLRRWIAIGVGGFLVLFIAPYTCNPEMPLISMPRRGRVFDRQTGEPIAGAQVFLAHQIIQGVGIHRSETLETRWTETDSAGRFRFGFKLFDDVGSRWTFWLRTPTLVAFHKRYHTGTASFDHQGYGLPFFEIPIDLKRFEEGEDLRKLQVNPREHYRNPRHLSLMCGGLSEAACQHFCEWAYELSEDECRRVRERR